MTLHTADLPDWLLIVAWTSIALGLASAVFIAVDVTRRPQPMAVMNAVWPICSLFGSVIWVAAYLWWGRAEPRDATSSNTHDTPGTSMDGESMKPALGKSGKPHSMPVSVFVGTSHCGAGCSLADLIVEWAIFALPGIAVLGGLHWLFSDELYAGWVIAYVVALVIGIAFQFAAIAPMNPKRGVAENIRVAAKADFLSLSAWQIGMYGAMAIAQLAVFPAWLDGRVAVDTPVFWLVMQLAMLAGFCTSYPVNWWLIESGIKEAM
ncbi:DUF4396 domain-containing protein [Gordonia sp. CPCC 205515]|uniref:DUF4396 domain-containing protein n=1 Tax=Gordonia sp. CPCC 205515 TaxID=3140791 RepID=UPI003AF3BF67